jgi:hypothetical protein
MEMVGARLRRLVVVNYPARWFNPTTAASYKVTVKLGYTGSGAWRGTVTLPLIRAVEQRLRHTKRFQYTRRIFKYSVTLNPNHSLNGLAQRLK